VIFLVIAVFASKPTFAETLQGTVIDSKPLTRTVDVPVPYEVCGLVKRYLPANYTDYGLFKWHIAKPMETYVNQCRIELRNEKKTELDGFLVTYKLKNTLYQTLMKVKPESKIDVKISHSIQ
jgi:hypothetical protein